MMFGCYAAGSVENAYRRPFMPRPEMTFGVRNSDWMIMNLRILLAVAAVLIPFSAHAEAPRLNLSHERFVLSNGLTLIVQEDRSIPIVSVNVWYGVGSKSEPEGKTGFAHLFEHLMFNGSENFDGEWFAPIREVGGAGINGTTSPDRTNYYQTVPTPALDRVLWMESDRMGHFLGAITQAKLDEQRGVVQNEGRQNDNRPYGRVNDALYEGLFPPEHPYHHPIIGSTEDLEAASLDDVRNWFRSFYGPNNAVVVIAGDVTPQDARARVERYFGDIPAGPEVDRATAWIPLRQHDTREVQYDDVPAVLADRVWAVPGFGTRDRALLDIAAAILGTGPNARFNRELVRERQIASSVAIGVIPHELASVFDLAITLEPGQPASVANEAIDRLMAQFLADGPTEDELARVVTGINARHVRRFEIGATRAQFLAEGELHAGDPNFVGQYLRWINEATPGDVRDAARRHLAQGSHQIDVLPAGTYAHAVQGVDRSAGLPPVPEESPAFVFPSMETSVLSNGARLVVVNRPTIPAVEISVQFDAGSAADTAPGGKQGAALFTLATLKEGVRGRDALDIANEVERLGARIDVTLGREISGVDLKALKDQLEPSLALWADVVMRADFPEDAIDRYRQQVITRLRHDQADPEAIADRILPAVLYGEGHVYGVPRLGTEATAGAIARSDLIHFRDTWLRPDNASIFVVGDTTLQEIQPLLERALRNWRAPETPLPVQHIADPVAPRAPRIILVDRPGSPQSLILGGRLGPRGDDANVAKHVAFTAMNDVFGGAFTARLNMNLREDKHWSYGVRSGLPSPERGPQMFTIRAPVQSDRTGDALAEILRELADINGARPITPAEMTDVVRNSVRQLPLQLQQSQGVLRETIATAARLGRPLNFAGSLQEAYESLTLTDLQSVARDLLSPDAMTWVIVGDRALIEPQIAALNIAPIEIFTAEALATIAN